MTWILWFVIFALAALVLVLWVALSDAKMARRVAETDAKRWKDEARSLGWKSCWEQMDEALGSLRASTATLRNVTASLRGAAKIQAENARKLDAVDASLRQANVALKTQSARLADAARGFSSARSLLPAAPDVDAEVRRAESLITVAGPVTDRTKLN